MNSRPSPAARQIGRDNVVPHEEFRRRWLARHGRAVDEFRFSIADGKYWDIINGTPIRARELNAVARWPIGTDKLSRSLRKQVRPHPVRPTNYLRSCENGLTVDGVVRWPGHPPDVLNKVLAYGTRPMPLRGGLLFNADHNRSAEDV